MTRRHSGVQIISEAKRIAQDHGMFIAEQPVQGRTEYIVYRRSEPRNIRIGKRSDPAALRRFVCQCANFH